MYHQTVSLTNKKVTGLQEFEAVGRKDKHLMFRS
jgi:hypothetical protein